MFVWITIKTHCNVEIGSSTAHSIVIWKHLYNRYLSILQMINWIIRRKTFLGHILYNINFAVMRLNLSIWFPICVNYYFIMVLTMTLASWLYFIKEIIKEKNTEASHYSQQVIEYGCPQTQPVSFDMLFFN